MASADATSSAMQGERSPIAKLLESLGMTREDLSRHSAQMREFLLTENPALRALGQSSDKFASTSTFPNSTNGDRSESTRSSSEIRSQSVASTRFSHPPKTPPPTHSRHTHYQRHTSKQPVHTNGHDDERVAEKRTPRRRKEKARRQSHSATSPSRPKPSLDMIMQMQSRNSRRVYESEESEESDDASMDDVFSAVKPRSSPRYRYPHPAKAALSLNQTSTQADATTSSSSYYRQESPSLSSGRSYYRRRDASMQRSVTPSSSIQQDFQLLPSAPQVATPTKSHYRQQDKSSEKLPTSSPIPPSSPIQSSPDYAMPMASSPGPMSDPPDQSDPDLPYILPPEPYSTEKPDLSYAALIGRAILASPNRALRLKDIYDYISIVFPYYKRDGNSHSQKWMNAIRQNLTNTPQFHKRESTDRSSKTKGSLWYIKDEDLACFNNGGYFRHANSPYSIQLANAKLEKKRKRKEEEKQIMESAKRIRIGHIPPAPANPYHFPYGYPQMTTTGYPMVSFATNMQPQVHSDIIFPPLPLNHPNAHLVNGNQPMVMENATDGIIFPPLPASSQTRFIREQKVYGSSASQISVQTTISDDELSPASAPPMSAASSMSEASSIPDLTPNNSSSSPLTLGEEEQPYSHSDVHVVENGSIAFEQHQLAEQTVSSDEDERAVEEAVLKDLLSVIHQLPPMPTTPTGKGKKGGSTLPLYLRYHDDIQPTNTEERPATPPRPSTPTGRRMSVPYNESLMRTPIARKSSKEKLAADTSEDAWKQQESSKEEASAEATDTRMSLPDVFPKTPSRRVSGGSGPSNIFTTPRKLFSSPFPSFSPFRTPSRRYIYDAADPSNMLDDELTALASNAQASLQDSPVGFFARGKGLLYESPCMPSPGQYRPW